MNIIAQDGLQGLAEKAVNTLYRYQPEMAYGLGNAELRLGLASDSRYQPDASAILSPLFVGDKRWVGKSNIPQAADSALRAGRKDVGFNWVWNGYTKKYDMKWAQARNIQAQDGYSADSDGPIIAGSLLSPNSINWIAEVFKQPLAWSDIMRLVKVQQGTNPWAEVQELPVAAFSGFATTNTSGSPDNTMSQDVEIQSGLIANSIINIDATYKLSIQELERARSSSGEPPYAGQLIAEKQAYANWVIDILTSAIIVYGNAATGTPGLLNVNSITEWSSVGSNKTLSYINADGANTAKGSTAYQQLATAVADFLTNLQNKVSKVHITVSPLAYNLLGKMPYSDVYNPNAALKIMVENFMSGRGESGITPDIDIVPDPMLSATSGGVTNAFNSNAYDYLILTADQIGTGPDEEPQSLIWFGMPLTNFVYPVVPQQFSTQYRTLRRISGIYAPLTTAVKVYSNYGIGS
jgi:hypothetical protein